MTARITTGFAASLILLFIIGIGASQKGQSQDNQQQSQQRAEQIITDWPQTPQKVAREMIQKYSQTEGVTQSRLIRQDKQPWSEIIVYRKEIPHEFPIEQTDVLEQVVGYEVPPDKFDELAEYDGSVIVERTKGTMAARCDKEEAKYLALNLTYEIVEGNKNVEEAREFCAETIQKIMSGEKPEYTQKLVFQSQQNAGDPDEAIIEKRRGSPPPTQKRFRRLQELRHSLPRLPLTSAPRGASGSGCGPIRTAVSLREFCDADEPQGTFRRCRQYWHTIERRKSKGWFSV